MRYTGDKNKGGGTSPPSKHSFKIKEKERQDYHTLKGYFNNQQHNK